MAVKPWENLRFISKIEIVPPPGQKGVQAFYHEEFEYANWSDGPLSSGVLQSGERRIHLFNEVVNILSDYPDDFKKLVKACGGHFEQAYEIYKALQQSVPADWDTKPETDRDNCDCC